jgi:aminopeptidase N
VAFRPTTRTRLAVLAVACSAVLGTSVALPAGALQAAPEAGAAGIGDPYFPTDGNGGYDVAHYDIHDTYTVTSGRLVGWTGIDAVTTADLKSFNLDLVLAVDDVQLTVNGVDRPVRFAKDGKHELVVTPTAPLPDGTEFSVRVDYHGVPQDIGYQKNHPWISSADEGLATNEPQIAPWWFPANDHPRDKATFDIEVKVPTSNEAISNGELIRTQDDGTWATWQWRMTEPMAPYLAFFAAGQFQIDEGDDEGLHYYNAVSKQLPKGDRDRARALMARTPGIVRWLESQFGDYPYSWTGGVTTSVYSGFALENQSRPTYPYLGNKGYGRSVVVHELAHQWFGDQVSVRRWRDIWLNEGFASWVEWRYDEAHGGPHAQKTLHRHYSAYLRSDPFWNLEIGDPGPKRTFAYPVYERGAMALQALRHRIGNSDFQRLLRTWVAEHADGNGTVGQFHALAEQTSGKQLDGFFEAWLFTGAKPARTKANGLQ